MFLGFDLESQILFQKLIECKIYLYHSTHHDINGIIMKSCTRQNCTSGSKIYIKKIKLILPLENSSFLFCTFILI